MKKNLIYVVMLLSLAACGSGNRNLPAESSTRESGEHETEEEIVFPPEQARAAGLEVITVERQPFARVIRVSGQILSAPGDEVTVVAPVSGVVTFLKSSLEAGVAVRSGESLAAVSSRELQDGDQVLKTRLAYESARTEFERAETLIEEGLISQKDYEQSRLNYETSRVTYEALSGKSGAGGVTVSSPMTGYLKNRLVGEGEYAGVGQPLLVVSRNRRLQLRADVPERYYGELPAIRSAYFRTPYEEDVHKLEKLNGKLISYGRSSGPQEHYIPVNFEFDNVGAVVPGSYVQVYLLGHTEPGVLTVPLTSLVEAQGLYFVFVQVDEEGYRRQEVTPGPDDGERVSILSGLQEGDRVVSRGAMHLKLASQSGAIPHGHQH